MSLLLRFVTFPVHNHVLWKQVCFFKIYWAGHRHIHTTQRGVGLSSYFIKFIECFVKFDQLDDMLKCVIRHTDRLQCDLIRLLFPFCELERARMQHALKIDTWSYCVCLPAVP